jgi:putative FmdB family regulatory protein
MPTYEYKCPKCGTEFELFQKITAKAAARCPKCGAKAERQMSAGAGLVFKGSGFYLTDYGRSGQKAKESAGESKADTTESKSEKSEKSETKKADATALKADVKPKPKKKAD